MSGPAVSNPIASPMAKTAAPTKTWVHVPTPGDHYSPATGSAVMTVIYELSRCHDAEGFATTVVVSKGTTHGYPPYPIGKVLEADLPTSLPPKRNRILEACWGRLGGNRLFTASRYAKVPAALGRGFGGTVFVHNSPAAIPLLRRELPNACLVLYAHNQLFNSYSPREVRRVLDQADAVVCVSDFIARDITARAGLATRSGKLKVALNGVDTERFVPAAHAPSDDPLVLFVGRMLPEKGPDLLVKAAADIASSHKNFRLRLVGSSNFAADGKLTPYEQHLRTLAAPLGDRVEFQPFVPRHKIVEEYHQASIFVAPSNWDEPFGLTIAEALACGLPSIVSDRGGIPEVAGDAALYFPPPDTVKLCNVLADLISSPDKRLALAERARGRALDLQWQRRYAVLSDVMTHSSPTSA